MKRNESNARDETRRLRGADADVDEPMRHQHRRIVGGGRFAFVAFDVLGDELERGDLLIEDHALRRAARPVRKSAAAAEEGAPARDAFRVAFSHDKPDGIRSDAHDDQ